MKKYFKKTLALLLVVTSFNVLPMIDKATINILTYAKIDTEQDQDIEKLTFEGHNFFHVKDTPFNIRSNIYDKRKHSKDLLEPIYKNSIKKANGILGLNYTDELKIPIFVLSTNEFLKDPSIENFDAFLAYPSNGIGETQIFIKNELLSNDQTLAHEMVHFLLWHELGNFDNLNLGINEGLATQAEKLRGYYEFLLPSIKNLYFGKSCPADIINLIAYYSLHQHIMRDWIKAGGKDMPRIWLEKVKNGEDSVQAFRDLGGNKIIEKYEVMFKCRKILIYTLLLAPLTILYIIPKAVSFTRKTYNKIKDFFTNKDPRVKRVVF